MTNNPWQIYLKHLEKLVNNDKNELNNITSSIKNVFDSIFQSNKNKILLYGLIQSGKTNFLFGLIFRLFSMRQSNIILYLCQPNTCLLNQNIQRFKSIYNNNFFEFKDIKKYKDNIITKIKNQQNIVIFLLKNKVHLEQANSILDNVHEHNSYVTIIDDEGDTISFNNIANDDGTTIFNLIKRIFANSNNVNLLSVTATPYAHFMVDKDNFMNPNMIHRMYVSSQYTGLDYFINEHNNNKSVFKRIETIDKRILDELSYNNDLKQAILVFICQIVLWKDVFNFDGFPKMIVNIDNKRISHDFIYDAVKTILNRIKKAINLENIIHIIENEFKISNYNDLSLEDILAIIENIEVKIFNGNDKTSFDNVNLHSSQIIIGNKKLDRGITFIDLVNCFISFRSDLHPNADYILQQARFLGYRNKYKKLIRLFLTNELIHDYYQIKDNIFDFIERIDYSENDFNNIEKFIPLSDENKLFPTRHNISDYEYITNLTAKIDFIKNRFYDLNSEIETKSIQFLNKFIQKTNKQLDSENNEYVTFKNFIEFCEYFFNTTNKDKIRNILNVLVFYENESENLNRLFEWKDYKYIVRLLKINNRKIYKKTSNYYTIGKGTYATNEKEFYLKEENCFSLDIIPISLWNDESDERTLIYRIRIYMPKNKNNNFISGYKTKTL